MTDIVRVSKNFGNPHRIFLNLVVHLNAVRVSRTIDVFKRICEACGIEVEAGNLVTNDDLAKHLVKTINKEFEKRDLLFKVQVVPDERYSNESLFIWTNSTKFEKDLAGCSLMTGNEPVVFFRIVHYLFHDANQRGEIPFTLASNMGRQEELMKPKDCEQFLSKLVANGSLTLNNIQATYSLHPRAVIEMDEILRGENYNIPVCPICTKLIPIARTASKCEECETELHNICIKRLLGDKTQIGCPGRKDNGAKCKFKFDTIFVKNIHFDVDVDDENGTIEVQSVNLRRSASNDAVNDEEAGDAVNDEEADDAVNADEAIDAKNDEEANDAVNDEEANDAVIDEEANDAMNDEETNDAVNEEDDE